MLNTILNKCAFVDGVFINAGDLPKFVQKYSGPLTINSNFEEIPFYFLGSFTPIQFHDRKLVVATSHQIDSIRDARDICFLLRDGTGSISSSRIVGYLKSQRRHDTDMFDLIAFPFDGLGDLADKLDFKFFPFTKLKEWEQPIEETTIIVAGYPFEKQHFVTDHRYTGISSPVILGQGCKICTDTSQIEISFSEDLAFNPNGLSGSPAFGICKIDGVPAIDLLGIVLRGGRKTLRVLRSECIFAALHAFFVSKP